MIIILIISAISVLSIFICVASRDYDDAAKGPTISICLIFAILLLYCVLVNAAPKRNIAIMNAKREGIVAAIQHNEKDGYIKAGEFNAELIKHKIHLEDPWTSWFYSGWMEAIEEIDISK